MSSLPLQAPDDLKNRLRSVSEPIHVSKSPVIFRQGEPSRGVFLVERGEVCLSIVDEKNAETIFERTLGRGSLLGLPATINNLCYSATATVLEDAQISHVSREALLNLMSDEPSIAMMILQLLSQEIHDMRNVIVRNSRSRPRISHQHN